MANQRSLCVPRLPDRLQDRTKKDKLFNDLICLVDGLGLKLYYTTYPRDVLCIHCGSTENIVDSEEEMFYPCCNNCSNKDKVYKRGAAKK